MDTDSYYLLTIQGEDKYTMGKVEDGEFSTLHGGWTAPIVLFKDGSGEIIFDKEERVPFQKSIKAISREQYLSNDLNEEQKSYAEYLLTRKDVMEKMESDFLSSEDDDQLTW